jgi:transcriptional regulator with XRE-family HTH domain
MIPESVISSNLKREITARGLNANKLAIASGVPASRLGDILLGKTKDPRLNTVIKLAAALEISLDDLAVKR